MNKTLRDDQAIEEKRKDKIPYDHYRSLLKENDPKVIAENCNCSYDEENQVFEVRVMGSSYYISYPEGEVHNEKDQIFDNYKLKTMILRFLINAKGVASTGEAISYRDVSGGNVYFACFEGRCLKRLAFTFNHDPEGLKRAMVKINAKPLDKGDLSWRFEFINDMYMTIILWLGDDEFPPESQILFDANFPSVFSAEDMAVMGDIFIPILKELSRE